MVRLSTTTTTTTTTLTLGAAALPAVRAILVTPGSPCAPSCGNVLDSTSPADVVCPQQSYAGATGQLFQGCVECEMRSGHRRANDSDVEAMLYNLRYAVSYCLFGTPDNNDAIDTPCITSKACGPFHHAVEYKNLSSKFKGYEYCQEWPVDDQADFKGCTDCLQAAENRYLANFVTVLHAGCQQKPAPGIPVGLEGNVFSADYVNITAPSPTAAVDPAWFDQGPLNLGAKVGIAVGAFVLVLMALGCAIVANGKRRRRAYLRELEAKYAQKGWPSPNGAGETLEAHNGQQRPLRAWDDTPDSQRPLRGWDDSPISASTERTAAKSFSPYSAQLNSPVNAPNDPNVHAPRPALGLQRGIGIALGGDDGTARWAASPPEGKSKDRQEAYEMHQVDSTGSGSRSGSLREHTGRGPRDEAPVLGRPGYEEAGGSPPRQHALTEDDARSGNAI